MKKNNVRSIPNSLDVELREKELFNIQKTVDNIQRIAFVCEGAYRGGVERTLIEWIKTLPKEKYDVTLYLINVEGELLGEIPDFVHIEKIPELNEILNGDFRKRLKWVIQKKNIIVVIQFLISAMCHKYFHNRGVYYRKLVNFLPSINKKYDYVISYTMPDSICTSYVVERMGGRYKWMWSHIDVNFYKNNELKGMDKTFQAFDKIVNVGQDAKKSFETMFPKLKDKSVLIRNHLDVETILEKSLELCQENDRSVINLLTVGRISYQKGQDIAIDVAKKMSSKKIEFHWYFIGPKSDENYYNLLKRKVENEKLENRIFYLGQTDNPYKYMKSCDIYVQPSRFEGYCTTVTEAQILSKPIILTDVAGAKEQVDNGVTGFITRISADEIEKKLELLIADETMRKMSENAACKFKREMSGFEDVIETLKG